MLPQAVLEELVEGDFLSRAGGRYPRRHPRPISLDHPALPGEDAAELRISRERVRQMQTEAQEFLKLGLGGWVFEETA